MFKLICFREKKKKYVFFKVKTPLKDESEESDDESDDDQLTCNDLVQV